jgi:hypothetical protein
MVLDREKRRAGNKNAEKGARVSHRRVDLCFSNLRSDFLILVRTCDVRVCMHIKRRGGNNKKVAKRPE